MRLADDQQIRPSLVGLCSQMVVAWLVAEFAFQKHGFEATVTSGSEGQHGRTSLHNDGSALDFETKHLPRVLALSVSKDVTERLGPDYDVLLEMDPPHLHIEWQPKNRFTDTGKYV